MDAIYHGNRILMSDWTEKRIQDLSEGEEIIGFTKKGRFESRLVKSRVLLIRQVNGEFVESTMDCGRSIRHTLKHRFLRPSNGGDFRYVPLRVGCKAVSIYKPTSAPSLDDQRCLDWLGGILDGEGSISKTGCAISQQERSNPEIFSGIKQVLEQLGIDYSIGMTHTSARFSLKGGRSLLIRLHQHSRMMKLARLEKALWGSRQISETVGRGGGRGQPRIVGMRPVGNYEAFQIETETRNLVCEGFAVFQIPHATSFVGAGLWQAA